MERIRRWFRLRRVAAWNKKGFYVLHHSEYDALCKRLGEAATFLQVKSGSVNDGRQQSGFKRKARGKLAQRLQAAMRHAVRAGQL
jgi:hypothetical protein